jgi:hypothetical protein
MADLTCEHCGMPLDEHGECQHFDECMCGVMKCGFDEECNCTPEEREDGYWLT